VAQPHTREAAEGQAHASSGPCTGRVRACRACGSAVLWLRGVHSHPCMAHTMPVRCRGGAQYACGHACHAWGCCSATSNHHTQPHRVSALSSQCWWLQAHAERQAHAPPARMWCARQVGVVRVCVGFARCRGAQSPMVAGYDGATTRLRPIEEESLTQRHSSQRVGSGGNGVLPAFSVHYTTQCASGSSSAHSHIPISVAAADQGARVSHARGVWGHRPSIPEACAV
jgi:hypothetical protein